MTFSEEELRRYARHIVLPGIGGEGQRRLLDARILVVGAGGLGSPAAMYLAAAGVGTLGVVDDDRVDASNLQRQLLHDTDDVGRPKVESAVERLRGINPTIDVRGIPARVEPATAATLLAGWDVVVDGTDTFPTRYLLNDVARGLGIPLVHGAVQAFDGQVTTFVPDGPCYRCLFPMPPEPGTVPSCAEGGVFGVLPGIVGTIQATEAIKLVTQVGEPLVGRLLLVDAMSMEMRTVAFRRDPSCAACGSGERASLRY